MRLWIFRRLPWRDVLPVTGKIGKADGLVVKYPQEAGRAAAMLEKGCPSGC